MTLLKIVQRKNQKKNAILHTFGLVHAQECLVKSETSWRISCERIIQISTQ